MISCAATSPSFFVFLFFRYRFLQWICQPISCQRRRHPLLTCFGKIVKHSDVKVLKQRLPPSFCCLSLFFFPSPLAALGGSLNCTVTLIPPAPATLTHTHADAHTHCHLFPKRHWRPNRYKQVSASHGRQFVVAPPQLSISVGRDQGDNIDLIKSKGGAGRLMRLQSDQAMLQKVRIWRMSRGSSSTCEHKLFTKEHNKLVETSLLWLPTFLAAIQNRWYAHPAALKKPK